MEKKEVTCSDSAGVAVPDESWSVKDHKDFLRKHGAYLTGKKKELLERYDFYRCKRAFENDLRNFYIFLHLQGAFLQTTPRCCEDKEGHDVLCCCVFACNGH